MNLTIGSLWFVVQNKYKRDDCFTLGTRMFDGHLFNDIQLNPPEGMNIVESTTKTIDVDIKFKRKKKRIHITGSVTVAADVDVTNHRLHLGVVNYDLEIVSGLKKRVYEVFPRSYEFRFIEDQTKATNLRKLVEEMENFYLGQKYPLPKEWFVVRDDEITLKYAENPEAFEQFGPDTKLFKDMAQMYASSRELYYHLKYKCR